MREYEIEAISGLIYEDEKIYFISAYVYNILYYDCKDKIVKWLEKFPKEMQIVGAFEKIVKYGDKIYLFPCFADDVYCYDMKLNEYRKLNIMSSIIYKMQKRKVLEVLVYNKKIYCICRFPNIVIRIDPETDDSQIYEVPFEILEKLDNRSIENTFFSVCMNRQNIVFPYTSDTLIEFSIKKNTFNLIKFSENKGNNVKNKYDNVFHPIIDRFGDLWVCSYRGELFKIIDNKKIQISMPNDFEGMFNDGNHEQPGINNIYAINDELCFVLRSDYRMLRYNIITKKFSWDKNSFVEKDWRGNNVVFLYTSQLKKDMLLEYSRDDGAVYIWDYKKGFVNKIIFTVPVNEILENGALRESDIGYNSKLDDLESYISFVKKDNSEMKYESKFDYGRQIYNALIN